MKHPRPVIPASLCYIGHIVTFYRQKAKVGPTINIVVFASCIKVRPKQALRSGRFEFGTVEPKQILCLLQPKFTWTAVILRDRETIGSTILDRSAFFWTGSPYFGKILHTVSRITAEQAPFAKLCPFSSRKLPEISHFSSVTLWQAIGDVVEGRL